MNVRIKCLLLFQQVNIEQVYVIKEYIAPYLLKEHLYMLTVNMWEQKHSTIYSCSKEYEVFRYNSKTMYRICVLKFMKC